MFARWRYERSEDADALFATGIAGRVSNLNAEGVERFREALGV